jgi:XTP/dITP diphosphohydrolase
VKRLLFLTGNLGKLAEAQHYFVPLGYRVEQFLLNGKPPEVFEPQADSLRIVASAKISQARKLLDESGEEGAILVDDSGLFIDSLNGFPGVSSASVHSQIGSLGILDLMEGREERGAEFRTCAILWDGEEYIGEGICRGRIIAEERGENGFGYDPIFVPDDLGELSSEGQFSDSGSSDSGTSNMLTSEGRTFAELETAEKNAFSHRRKALEAVLNRLR